MWYLGGFGFRGLGFRVEGVGFLDLWFRFWGWRPKVDFVAILLVFCFGKCL